MELRRWMRDDITPGTRVLLRLDVNVPITHGVAHEGEHGRIAAAIPEIVRLRAHGARIILATHLSGRDSVFPVARLLQERLRRSITLIPALGEEAERQVLSMEPGDIVMLENLRHDPGEEANDEVFAKKLSKLADVYINNAFGVCHRNHASVVAITKFLPSFAGELIAKEVRILGLEPTHPFVLILGGAKLTTKIPIIQHLGEKADKILLGGAIAIPFLKALDRPLPEKIEAFVQKDEVTAAENILRTYMEKLLVPEDVIDVEGRIVDIGPKTSKLYAQTLKGASTVIWNGPLGIVEEADGRAGTVAIAQALAKTSPERSILGGGDTVTFFESEDLLYGFTHISTGGGAMLAFLSGEKLPGLEVLKK